MGQQSHTLPCRTPDQTCLGLSNGTSRGCWASGSAEEHRSKTGPAPDNEGHLQASVFIHGLFTGIFFHLCRIQMMKGSQSQTLPRYERPSLSAYL